MAKKHSDDERGQQKGAAPHAEGQHGEKAHEFFQTEQIRSSHARSARGEHADGDPTHSDPGRDRLFEGREQHDDAELQSEKNRLSRDIERHHHERREFDDVVGGTTRHPKLPPENK